MSVRTGDDGKMTAEIQSPDGTVVASYKIISYKKPLLNNRLIQTSEILNANPVNNANTIQSLVQSTHYTIDLETGNVLSTSYR